MATQPSDAGKPRTRAGGDELAVIAQRAQAFTNASGVAIALSEGNVDEIVCRARSGSSAPDVGAALRVEGTFTGLCIQSGKELRCDDAETDTRVDTAAIRALGIRSMVVTPIKEESRVIGVLAVFASTAHAFTITHVAVLKTMADQIVASLQRERRAKEEGHQPEYSAPAAAPKAAPVFPPPVVIRPAAPATAAAPARAAAPAVAKMDTIRATALAEPVVLPKKIDERPAEPKAEPSQRASFGTLDAVATEGKRSSTNNIKILGVAAVMLIAAVSTFAVLRMRKPSGPVHASAAPVTQPQPQPENTTATSATAVPANLTINSTPSSASSNNNTSPVKTASESKKPARNAEAARNAESSRNAEASAVEEPRKPQPSTIALASGPSRISAGDSQPVADVAPALTVSTNNANGLSTLAKATESAPSVSVQQSHFEPMQVLKRVAPVFPAIAKIRRANGVVKIQITVTKEGKVTNPQFISGPTVFRDAAFDAVKQWSFKPAKLNGQPIDQLTQVEMDFNR